MSTRRLIVGPFNRVEGDLEVRLDVVDGRVQQAQVSATMYRGFETLLPGRDPLDALVIVPRICGICSVSQSVAAAYALADAAGVQAPPNGQHALNLMQACENLADHLTHFYLFFMPDFTRPVYADRPWYAEACRRFAAVGSTSAGAHTRLAVAARQRWFHLMGVLGGKWPHTHSLGPGGSSRAIDAAERLRLLALVREFQAFLEDTVFGVPLEVLASLGSEAELQAWWAQDPQGGDLRFFLGLVADLGLAQLGPGPGRYLSLGSYRQPEGGHLLAAGLWQAGQRLPVPWDAVTEDATYAWLDDAGGPLAPAQGRTVPAADKAEAYTWNKAPRLAGQVVETGAIARQLNAGQPLVCEAVARTGGNVYTRVLARLIELAAVVPQMINWLQALRPNEVFHQPVSLPAHAEGCGQTEAARGALAHWLRIEEGRLSHYQIVAPTSWNFSPRDAQGQPGALEAALQGAPVRPGEASPVSVQHIVRSFDPCMVCTVH